MAKYINTKFGEAVNIATYEFICDDAAALAAIPQDEYKFGSVALVIHGTKGIEAYIADSEKDWCKM